MTKSPALVLSLCVVGLAIMSIISVLILRAQSKQDRLRLRVERTITTHQRVAVASAVAVPQGVGLAETTQGAGAALAKIFGFDPDLEDHYVLRWWVALSVTLILSLISAKIANGLIGKLVWLAVPVEWVVLSRAFFTWCRNRRRDALFTQFPDALAMIVRAVRVGIPVSEAIRAVGRDLEAPTGPEFARLATELAIGATMQEALKVMANRNGLQEYRFFATALSLQSQTGGGLSETLDNLADVIRKRVAVRQKGQALSAEAKMSSLVLGSLPPLAGVGLYIMNADYITTLFVDPMGQKILAAAVVSLTCGVMSMKYLIRKSLS